MEEDQDLRDIYQSTYGIIFFGTPHRGSSYAQMGVLARDIAVAAGFDARDTLIRSLKPDAEMLSLLRQEFARMLYDRAFKIYSFQEGQGFKGTYSLSRKVCNFFLLPPGFSPYGFFTQATLPGAKQILYLVLTIFAHQDC
jgi:hypothetical protein